MALDRDTTVVICNTVPFDNTYRHTIYFDSIEDQEAYFDEKIDYTFSNLTYQRVSKNKIRVQMLADRLYGDNYMYFLNNTNTGGKRFYCFITDVTYINDITSEITYEIDVMQTWHFNYTLGYTFVEREHVEDDTIGANTTPEPVDAGQIKCRRIMGGDDFALQDMTTYSAILATGYDPDGTPGGVYSGIPSGLNYLQFDFEDDGIDDMLDYIQEAVDNEKDDAIVAIWMQPTCTVDTDQSYEKVGVYGTRVVSSPTTIDGYTPANNKLFTYPYNYLCVDSGSEQGEYRYEWFNKSLDGASFWLYASTCPTPEMICVPVGYNTAVTNSSSSTYAQQENFTDAVILRDFPQIAWATDAYRAWVASGGYATMYLGVLGGVGQIGAGALSNDASKGVASVTSGLTSALSAMNEGYHQANKGATGHGTQSASALTAARGKDFYFKLMQINRYQARCIDDYFTMFGYQVNKIKIPNRSARPLWNYLKTRNCKIIQSAVPADDASKIESIYDNGITFWNKGVTNVGSYTSGYDNQS